MGGGVVGGMGGAMGGMGGGVGGGVGGVGGGGQRMRVDTHTATTKGKLKCTDRSGTFIPNMCVIRILTRAPCT